MLYPKTAPIKTSEAQCLFDSTRDRLAKPAKVYETTGTHFLYLYCSDITVAMANADVLCPDGNELSLD